MALTLIIANRPRCKPRAEAGGWHKMGGATVWEGINRGEWGWGDAGEPSGQGRRRPLRLMLSVVCFELSKILCPKFFIFSDAIFAKQLRVYKANLYSSQVPQMQIRYMQRLAKKLKDFQPKLIFQAELNKLKRLDTSRCQLKIYTVYPRILFHSLHPIISSSVVLFDKLSVT